MGRHGQGVTDLLLNNDFLHYVFRLRYSDRTCYLMYIYNIFTLYSCNIAVSQNLPHAHYFNCKVN